MIIVKLLVADKEQGDAVANSLLKNKFTLNVFANPIHSYRTYSQDAIEQTEVYLIQFITKSSLFNEIEETLKKEFPLTHFSICATPIVHMAVHLHDKIRKKVNGEKYVDDESQSSR